MANNKVGGVGSYNAICPVCGWKYKASELKRRWDGLMVCPTDWETRHPMDFFRTIPDQKALPFVLPDFEDVPSSTQFYLNFNGSLSTKCIAFKTTNQLDFQHSTRPFPITIEFWCFNHDPVVSTNRTISRNDGNWAIRTNTTFQMNYFLWSATQRYQFASTYVPAVDTWVKYELTCPAAGSNGDLNIYGIDGTLLSTESLVPTIVAAPSSSLVMTIGHNFTSSPVEIWNGGIEEFRVWTDVRTSDELLTYRFKELSGGEQGLFQYFKFNGQNPEYVSSDLAWSTYKYNQGWQITPDVTYVNETFMRP